MQVLLENSFFVGFIFCIYSVIILAVMIQVINDSVSPSKTMGYLLLIFFIPLVGVILYLSFGVNYRNRKMYSKKLDINQDVGAQVEKYINFLKNEVMEDNNPAIQKFKSLATYLASSPAQWLNKHNKVTLLNNGEEKFPVLLEALQNARHSIHLEYYIVRDDNIGRQIKNMLIKKAKEGVKVRFIYDAFGGRFIQKAYARELREAGVEIYPFRKLIFIALANRLNYRNHRKIVVIDGKIGFVGGINIGDEYINDGKKKYWRDVHIKLEGYSCYALQYIFLSDWNFCSQQNIEPSPDYFPVIDKIEKNIGKTVQIVESGPDSSEPMIMNSLLMAIAQAENEILITTPYFVPSEAVINALVIAGRSDIKVKILIPAITDSKMVRMASYSLFSQLMEAGVEIYLYHRGFIHSKTSVFDRKLSFVGTANVDNRSFNLNFEVNAAIFDEVFAEEMVSDFESDLNYAEKVDYSEWKKRPKYLVFFDKIIYLASSLL